MARPIFIIILCTVFDEAVGKHIYIPQKMKWLDAQAYCRSRYIDLSFVSSQSDQDQIEEASGTTPEKWIGLYLDPNDKVWKWSGGGVMTYENWANNQPDNGRNGTETKALIWPDGKWNDANEDSVLPFYCFTIDIDLVKMSWEGALEYCKKTNTSLISLNSEPEHLLIQTVVQNHRSDRVWIGLRYLGARWLWVNGEPLEYQAWPGQDHQCPAMNRCGALTKDRLWETRDCLEENHFICE
uniref:C-type lectin domain-containing protein n=1 Tax=Sphaeramia orbicularis TaxID=375764 RepID=A0A673CXC0_9TELE